MDLVIYGNLTKDIIIDIDNLSTKQTSIGGIINSWFHFKKINKNNYLIDFIPMTYGESVILLENNKRFSKSNLNLKMIDYNIVKSKISHIMYLNDIENLDIDKIIKIKEKSTYLSADTCSSSENSTINIEYLKYIDFLFISEDEFIFNKELYLNNISGFIITHYPTGSNIYFPKINNITITEKDLEKENIYFKEKCNVLGAGDCFASAFIYYFLNNNCNIDNYIEALIYSHKSVNSIL